ncbi:MULTISPECIES: Flp pilus assembly protein CpaB [Alphaproteobacteria]|uniref:Flp pilus assembly protein CpaB n=1 Tax=Alphaproteobacteria TaxID=28211 RepID=UPI0012BC89A5|nr:MULTISPECIES: Flp pilus assembly protein CpaB [Alphaproteobacteria]MTH97311.1 Flp pilus assembly protein CpaB [Roseibium sp. RKSG952]
MRAVFGLVLIVGVALAGGAVYMARNYISEYQAQLARERQAAQEALANAKVDVVPTVEVVVSNRTLKYGEPLTKEDVRLVEWPETAVPEGSFTDMTILFPEIANGDRFVLRTMEKDEALMEVKVTKPGEAAGLTSRLEKGMRAFAISVDVASGVSGFLRPDDIVDVYWTGSLRGAVQGADGEITRLIQTNIQLIAVDQTAGSDVTGTTIARTVTVAATPEQIAALAQAQNTGRLSLALVGVQDETIASAIEVDQRKLLGIEEEAPKVQPVQEKVCTIRTRRGGETVTTEIPCTN